MARDSRPNETRSPSEPNGPLVSLALSGPTARVSPLVAADWLGRPGRADESFVPGNADRFQLVLGPTLAQDVVDVILQRTDGYGKFTGEGLQRPTLGEELQNLDLPRSEGRQPRAAKIGVLLALVDAVDQTGQFLRVDEGLTIGSPTYTFDELVETDALGQESCDARLQRLLNLDRTMEPREEEDLRSFGCLVERPGRGRSAHARHPVVHEHDGWLAALGQPDDFEAGHRVFGNHGDARHPAKSRGQRLGEESLGVGDQDRDGLNQAPWLCRRAAGDGATTLLWRPCRPAATRPVARADRPATPNITAKATIGTGRL